MEQVKNIEEEKTYAVYGHFYKNVIFYIGVGAYYGDEILKSRPYDFINRSKNWKEYFEGNTDQIKVRIFFKTNDRKEAYDFEEELTQRYFDHNAPLVNVNIGIHHSPETKRKISESQKGEKGNMWGKRGKDHPMYGKKLTKETRKRMSESKKGENHPMWGKTAATAKKVLVTNNESGETRVFDSIRRSYKFIVEKGYKKSYSPFWDNINNGPYNFKEYIFERVE